MKSRKRADADGVRDLTAAVVGAGVVGLACAVGLARAGVRVSLYGELPEAFDADAGYDMRVLAVNEASRAFLESVGAWEKVVAGRFFAYRAMSVWSGAGRVDFDADDAGLDALGYIVENRLLRSALFEAAQACDGLDARCPAMVRDLRQRGATTDIVTDDGEETFALVVGADGVNSRVRALAGMRVDYTDYAQRAVVATLGVREREAGRCRQRFFDDGVLAFLPLDAATVAMVWSCPAQLADELCAASPEAFARRVAEAFEMDAPPTPQSGRASFPVRGVRVREFVRRGVALVGDAAHTVHPMAGLGANLGLADARSLVREVAAHGVGAQALRRYMGEAQCRGFELRTLLDALHMAFAPKEGGAVATLREAALGCVGRSPCLKAWFARRAAWMA